MLLEKIQSPADLRWLGSDDLTRLCAEIRETLVKTVARTGGHLGPNLGVVELTVAIHRVFDSPRDSIVFDTGHQAYVHKLLTGRLAEFATLRQYGGLSGYPSRSESEHDLVENSHASTGLSYALALAKARSLQGEPGKVVCLVGDGALTGGMAYEALNNIGQMKPDMVIILNDNGRSYAPTVGGLADHLGQLRLSPKYEAMKDRAGTALRSLPVVGPSAYETAKRMKNSVKQLITQTSLFESLGLKYGGPIAGHDIRAVEKALRDAALYRGPVVVHVVTEKGHGYQPAIDDSVDRFHGVSSFDIDTGRPKVKHHTWTDVFGEALCDAAETDDRIVAITAAMASSTGLIEFSRRFPDRFFDVGIAEQHAVTFAAGLAMKGLRPVVCIYSSFLQRAFDQVICDAGIHKLPVVFVLDRAGVTGDDGASHHGMLDLAYLRCVPGMTVTAPSSPDELRRLLATGLAHDGPFSIRYPRGAAPSRGTAPMEPVAVGRARILREGTDVALVAAGKMVPVASAAAVELDAEGIGTSVVDVRFIKPLDPTLATFCSRHHLIMSIEDGNRIGGLGSALAELLGDTGIALPVHRIGLPDRFLEHGNQALLLEQAGLTAPTVAQGVLELLVAQRLGTPVI